MTIPIHFRRTERSALEAAVSAVRAALFKPFTESGVPRAVWVVAPINFNLQ